MSMPFCRSDKFRSVTWALSAGTSVGGDYTVDALTDLDPSLPLWIAETSIGLAGDCGSAVRIDGVALIHHTFKEGTRLRLRLNATNDFSGAVDVTVQVTVGAWEGLFAPHIYFNVAAATPVVGDRTKRYLVIDNLDANDQAVQIGEIVVAGEVETFAGLDADARAPESFGVAFNPSKKGVKTVHDWRSRDRIWEGHTIVDPGDTAFASLARASRGALPFLCWPEGDMSREPILARLSSPAFERSFVAGPDIYRVPVLIEELSCGEAY